MANLSDFQSQGVGIADIPNLQTTLNTLDAKVASAEAFFSTKVSYYDQDFVNAPSTGLNYPFGQTAISGGTSANNATNVAPNHVGILRMSSRATLNSGFRVGTESNTIQHGNGNNCNVVFMPLSNTALTRLAFHDTVNSTDATDGIYCEHLNGVLTFKTANNGVRSSVAFTTPVPINNWFTVKIVTNSPTLVTCTLYNTNGVLLETKTLTTNIPTANNRVYGFAVVSTTNTAVAQPLIDLDYMDLILYLNR
jgi:hypothetical protein